MIFPSTDRDSLPSLDRGNVATDRGDWRNVLICDPDNPEVPATVFDEHGAIVHVWNP